MKQGMWQNKKRSKKTLIYVGVIAVLILVAIAVYITFSHVGENEAVVKVNGEAVTARELSRHMSWNKAYVITYFKDEYDAEVDSDFWNRSYGDTTPNEYLREYTLKQLVRYKVEQQLAVSYGLMGKEETTYKSFLKKLEEENNSRSGKAQNGEIVYGVTQYTESTYFSYVYSNMQLRLQDMLSEKGEPLYVSDEDLKKWYEQSGNEELDFEEYKGGIRKEYTDEQYSKYIDGLVEKAETVKGRKYGKVVIE